MKKTFILPNGKSYTRDIKLVRVSDKDGNTLTPENLDNEAAEFFGTESIFTKSFPVYATPLSSYADWHFILHPAMTSVDNSNWDEVANKAIQRITWLNSISDEVRVVEPIGYVPYIKLCHYWRDKGYTFQVLDK